MFVITRGIKEALSESKIFVKEIGKSLTRYLHQDWGDMSEEDKKLNDEAYKNKNDRILACYETSEGKVYINANADRSQTNILFSNEYSR